MNNEDVNGYKLADNRECVDCGSVSESVVERVVSCGKPENIALEEDFLGNAIYRKLIRQGSRADAARKRSYEGIEIYRNATSKAASDVVALFGS